RHALADGDLALLFPELALHAGDLARDRDLLADALHAGDRALLPDGAGHPHLDGLGAHRARLAAVVAAVTVAKLPQPLPERRAAGNFLALVVALIDALAHDLGLRHAGPLRLHHGACFARGDRDADLADDFLDLRDPVVHGDLARPRFRDRLAAV